MIDMETVNGVGVLFGSAAAGAAGIAYIEKAGETTNERDGGLSDETKSRLAAKFMEDEELVTDLSDSISKMEAALAKAEGREVDEGDGLSEDEKMKLSTDW